MNSVVAIDGPSASGKSSVARRVASGMNWLYVDSGALYRGVTWLALQEGLTEWPDEKIAGFAQGVQLLFHVTEGAVGFRINGHAPGAALREWVINEHVSRVAADPAVRRMVTEGLRRMRELGSLVMEGRDIGTAVFPDADWKFYLDASPEERARRRHAELSGSPAVPGAGAVAASLSRRDAMDSRRKTDPLRTAEDAVVLDSTGLTLDQVVQVILDRIRAG